MEIYLPRANVMLFRSNFPLNSGLLLQVYNNVLTILSFISSSLIFLFPIPLPSCDETHENMGKEATTVCLKL